MLTATRLGAAALAGLLLAGATAPAVATGPVPAPPLYGRGDPAGDGVWRQSLALTALASAGVVPARPAVDWLLGQQCPDGGWTAYRTGPCDPAMEDTAAGAAAVQALAALGGHHSATDRGVQWLAATQNVDGSWARRPGGPGDAAATGLAISALLATGTDPATVTRDGNSGYDGLAALQLGCTAPTDQRGAFPAPPAATTPTSRPSTTAGPSTRPSQDLPASRPTTAQNPAVLADPAATARVLLAIAGGSLRVTTTNRMDAPPSSPPCPPGQSDDSDADRPTTSAESAAAYLAARLNANGQHLVHGSRPDYAATAWSVLGLIQAGHPEQAASAADWLAGNGYTWAARQANGTDPAATALLLLTAQAAKLDPLNFGGTNLVQLLINAGPPPASIPPAAAAAASDNPDGTQPPGSGITDASDDSGFSPIGLVAAALAVGVGGSLLLNLHHRRSAHRPDDTRRPATPAPRPRSPGS